MGYVKWSYETLNHFCGDVFKAFGFTEEESNQIKDVQMCIRDSQKDKQSQSLYFQLGFTMYEEEENRWRCSFRSDGKWINVNELLQAFCGGGHAAAAGVRKRTNDVDKFRPEILERIVMMRKISGQNKYCLLYTSLS